MHICDAMVDCARCVRAEIPDDYMLDCAETDTARSWDVPSGLLLSVLVDPLQSYRCTRLRPQKVKSARLVATTYSVTRAGRSMTVKKG